MRQGFNLSRPTQKMNRMDAQLNSLWQARRNLPWPQPWWNGRRAYQLASGSCKGKHEREKKP